MKTEYYKNIKPSTAKARIAKLVKEHEKRRKVWTECREVAERLGDKDSLVEKLAWERLDALGTAMRVLGITDMECLAD